MSLAPSPAIPPVHSTRTVMLPASLVITARASIVAALICVAQATAAGRPDTVLPVVLQAPACAHDKLGTVSIQIGTRVT